MTITTTASHDLRPRHETSAPRHQPGGPRDPAFTGAALPVCGADVLIVVVQPWVLADPHEARLYLVAFELRFRQTIVLMAQDEHRVPTYFGPAAIVRAIARLPFEIIPWQRFGFRVPRRVWRLPIPPDPAPEDERTTRYDSARLSIEQRMARSTVR